MLDQVLQGLRDVSTRAFRSSTFERIEREDRVPNIPAQLVFLRSGFTPGGLGADTELLGIIPHAPDGDTVAVYRLVRATAHVDVASTAGDIAIQIERLPLDAPNGLNQLNPSLSVPEGILSSYATAIQDGRGEFRSGDRVRIDVIALGTGSSGWHVSCELSLIGFVRPDGIQHVSFN